jgi:hypothetical protein
MALELVTSENREEYNAKKMAQRMGEKYEPEVAEEKIKKAKKKKEKEDREKMLIKKLGRKGAMEALEHERNMGDSEVSMPK